MIDQDFPEEGIVQDKDFFTFLRLPCNLSGSIAIRRLESGSLEQQKFLVRLDLSGRYPWIMRSYDLRAEIGGTQAAFRYSGKKENRGWKTGKKTEFLPVRKVALAATPCLSLQTFRARVSAAPR
jgi:hypothetical protein